MTLGHPFRDLAGFPADTLQRGATLWKVTGVDHAESPWWFSNSGDGRFDLNRCDNYSRPQEWASAWHSNGFDGIHFRLAHGTGLFGWAVFGEEGANDTAALSVYKIDDELLRPAGVRIESPPALSELDLIDDVAHAVAIISDPAVR